MSEYNHIRNGETLETVSEGDEVKIIDLEHAYSGRVGKVTDAYELLDREVVDIHVTDDEGYAPKLTVDVRQVSTDTEARVE